MALGEILRAAREAKGFTPSEVAEATRMMVQMVEELEREDFGRIAAPIYGKGFIRLYAEFVGVDSAPLIDEYDSVFVRNEKPPSLKSAITDVRDDVADNPPPAEVIPEVVAAAEPVGETAATDEPADESDPDLFEIAQHEPARRRATSAATGSRPPSATAPRPSERREGPAPVVRGAMAIMAALGAAGKSLLAVCSSIVPNRRSEFDARPVMPVGRIVMIVCGICLIIAVALGVRHALSKQGRAPDSDTPGAAELAVAPLPEPPLVLAPPEPYVD